MFKFRCDFYNFFTESEDFFSIQIDNTDFVTQKDLFLEAMSRAYDFCNGPKKFISLTFISC